MHLPGLSLGGDERARLSATRRLILAVALSLALFEVLHRYLALPPIVTSVILTLVFLPILVWGVVTTVLLLLSDPGEFGHGLRHAFVLLLLVVFFFAVLYTELGIVSVLGGPRETKDFWTCLYFSVVTFTTIGYGDLAPSVPARPAAAVEALAGYVLLGIIVAATFYFLTHRGQELNRARAEHAKWRQVTKRKS